MISSQILTKPYVKLSITIGAIIALLVLYSCGKKAEGAGKANLGQVTELSWDFAQSPFGKTHAVVLVPKSSRNTKFPVLIALHGQGESRKSPKAGAKGWAYDYGMIKAVKRLSEPPLTKDDFGNMITDSRLNWFNKTLKERSFRGLIVACPYLPDRFRRNNLYEDTDKYGSFLINTLLPKTYKETPAQGTTKSTGIDGVSLGGRASVIIGLTNPHTFGAVGGIQAAFGEDQAGEIASLVEQARKKNPKMTFRIMSSRLDRYKQVTERISSELTQTNVKHQMDIVEGNHSYEFNRGPGVYEMLLYYDRVLRGERY